MARPPVCLLKRACVRLWIVRLDWQSQLGRGWRVLFRAVPLRRGLRKVRVGLSKQSWGRLLLAVPW